MKPIRTWEEWRRATQGGARVLEPRYDKSDPGTEEASPTLLLHGQLPVTVYWRVWARARRQDERVRREERGDSPGWKAYDVGAGDAGEEPPRWTPERSAEGSGAGEEGAGPPEGAGTASGAPGREG